MAIESPSAVSTVNAPAAVAAPAFTPGVAVEKLAESLSQSVRDRLIDLEARGRLWVREGNGLRRIGIIEALERWAAGRAVAIVTALQQVKSQSTSASSMNQYDYSLLDDDRVARSSSSTTASSDVSYTYELVQNPKLLGFVRQGAGVDGPGEIPAQGGTVRLSTSFSWSSAESRSHAYWLKGVGASSAESSGNRVTT